MRRLLLSFTASDQSSVDPEGVRRLDVKEFFHNNSENVGEF